MTDVAKLGFDVNTAALRGANDELEKLPPNAGQAERATDKLNKGFDKGRGAASRFMASVRGVSGTLSGTLKSALFGVAAGFAAAFGATAIIGKITATAQALDDVSKAARAVGSSVQSMQALSVAGDLAGVSVDTVAMATKRMNRVLGAAIASGKGTSGVFKQLGISAKELAAMPIDVRFATIADRMKTLGFSATDTTAALAALGDRGGQLIGLLGEGGDQIRAAANDVAQFGLAISDLDGQNIEAMNDNFSRVGYAIQGAFNQFIAFVAPTLSGIFLGLANGIAFVVGNIDKIAPIAQIAGAALLTAFGPAILASVFGLITAIGSGLVGAIVAVGVAIAANPLGALAIAIVTIITAVWTFRDAIKNAIGIDVVAIAKNAGNSIIRFFLTAFEDIKFIWNNFPTIIGAAVMGAVNAVISGINTMISAAVSGLNSLIFQLKTNTLTAGLAGGLGFLDPKAGQIASMANPAANALGDAVGKRNAAVGIIQTTDYVGQLATAIGDLTAATDTSKIATDGVAGSVGNLGSVAENVAGGGASKMKDAMKAIQDEAAKTRERMEALRDTIMDTVGGAFKSFFNDLMHGKSVIDALGNALSGLADKLMDMVLNQAIMGLIGSLFGGGLGTGMGLTGAATYGFSGNGVFGVPGFAKGTVVGGATMFNSGGNIGKMAEDGPEAIMPLKRGSNGSLGVVAVANDNPGVVFIQPIINNNASDQVNASAEMDQNGNLIVMIDKINAGLVSDRGSRTNKALRTMNQLGQR